MRTVSGNALLVLVLVLAGCAGAPSPADDEGPEGPGDDPATTSDAPDPTNRTIHQAPTYVPGEWWKYRLADNFTFREREVVRVVAGDEPDAFLVGMGRADFNDEAMVLHIPGFGQIDKLDLGYEIHDVVFNAVQFPLTDGKSWTTAFEGRPMTANVTVVSDTEANLRFERLDGNGVVVESIDAVYDAILGEFRTMQVSAYGQYEIIDHGFNYTGVVRVPHQHDLIFSHGRVGGAANLGLQPSPPTESIEVDATYQRVSFAIILGQLAAGGEGYYRVTATAPDATVYELEMQPGEGQLKVGFFANDAPGGTWEAEFVAGGPGYSFLEGIAYHTFDVVLPEGCLLAMAGEHQHGDGACADPGD